MSSSQNDLLDPLIDLENTFLCYRGQEKSPTDIWEKLVFALYAEHLAELYNLCPTWYKVLFPFPKEPDDQEIQDSYKFSTEKAIRLLVHEEAGYRIGYGLQALFTGTDVFYWQLSADAGSRGKGAREWIMKWLQAFHIVLQIDDVEKDTRIRHLCSDMYRYLIRGRRNGWKGWYQGLMLTGDDRVEEKWEDLEPQHDPELKTRDLPRPEKWELDREHLRARTTPFGEGIQDLIDFEKEEEARELKADEDKLFRPECFPVQTNTAPVKEKTHYPPPEIKRRPKAEEKTRFPKPRLRIRPPSRKPREQRQNAPHPESGPGQSHHFERRDFRPEE